MSETVSKQSLESQRKRIPGQKALGDSCKGRPGLVARQLSHCGMMFTVDLLEKIPHRDQRPELISGGAHPAVASFPKTSNDDPVRNWSVEIAQEAASRFQP